MTIKLKKDDLKPGTKLAAVPAGIHTVKIKATVKDAKNASLELTVEKSTNKKAVGRKVFENVNEGVAWKIGQILASVFTNPKELKKIAAKIKTIKDLVAAINGKTVRVRTVQTTSEEYGTQAKVKQFLPVEASDDEDDDDDEEDEEDDDDEDDDEENEEDEDDEDEDEEENDEDEDDDDEDEEEDDEDEDEDDEDEEEDDEDEDEDEESAQQSKKAAASKPKTSAKKARR